MVLWELTLATAYVLGLPRTYRLALRLQRRLISPKHPRLRDFVYRRTRSIFSVALNVHKEVQRRDISVGRNIGNRILRFLDRMRPQANIRGSTHEITGCSVPKKPLRLAGKNPERAKDTPNRSDAKHATPVGKAEVDNPPYRYYVGGQFGSSIRSRFSNGLSRLTPTTRSQSLPVIAMGLWWQPVRKNMESVLLREGATPQSGLADLARLPKGPLNSSGGTGFSRGIMREDIAAWINRPQQG